MANRGYTQTQHLLYSPSTSVDSGETRYVVSKVIGNTPASSIHFALYFDVEDVVVGGGEEIAFYLQQFNGAGWDDVGVQAKVKILSGDGTYCMLLDNGVEAEALVLPLSSQVRLAAETGAASSCSVTRITTFDRT